MARMTHLARVVVHILPAEQDNSPPLTPQRLRAGRSPTSASTSPNRLEDDFDRDVDDDGERLRLRGAADLSLSAAVTAQTVADAGSCGTHRASSSCGGSGGDEMFCAIDGGHGVDLTTRTSHPTADYRREIPNPGSEKAPTPARVVMLCDLCQGAGRKPYVCKSHDTRDCRFPRVPSCS